MRDDKKSINFVPINPATHKALITLANQKGVRVNEFLGYLADTYFMNWYEPDGDKPLERAAWLSLRSKTRAGLRDEVYKAASYYLEHPTETGAEELAEQCDLVGLDYTQVISEIKSDPFSSLIEHSRNGSKKGDAIRWLTTKMKAHERFPAKLIFAMGKKQGFSQAIINSAKRSVNADSESPNINSVRTGVGWDWKIDTE